MIQYIVIILIVCIIFLFILQKHKKGIELAKEDKHSLSSSNSEISYTDYKEELEITIHQLNNTSLLDSANIVEITNKQILEKLNSCIPNIGQMLVNTHNTNVGKKITQEVSNYNKRYSDKLYEVIIPPNAKLFKSKTLKNANRGGYTIPNKSNSLGQANWKRVDPLEVSRVNKVTNIVSNAMSVASMVVGQYYMEEISAKLNSMSKEITDIKDFQDTEFKSKVGSILKKIMIVSKFKEEVIANSLITDKELAKLYDYEDEADQLLLHINMTMNNLINSNEKININTYEDAVKKYSLLGKQQEILLNIMKEAASLKYLLYGGKATVEYCNAKYQNSFEQSHAISKDLKTWHQRQIESLKIDIEKKRSKKVYFLSDKIAPVIGLMNDDLNYRSLSKNTVDSVKAQIVNEPLLLQHKLDVFDTKTRLIVNDNKIYYLPNEE